MEIWKDIKGYEGLYKISSYGRVLSLARTKKMPRTGGIHYLQEKVLSPRIIKSYYYVNLGKNGKRISYKVHRLVCSAFHENIFNKPDVNHKDCIKLNNNSYNLEWATKKENAQHATANGKHFYPNVVGTNNGRAKLTEENVISILKSNLSDNELAKVYGVCNVNIKNIRLRKLWKHINLEKDAA